MAGAANLTNAGKGRPKGAQNKATTQLKDMILQALDKAGGVDYLFTQAHDNPGPFIALLGKVMPMQINAELAGKIISEVRHRVIDRAPD
mgnify:CR=1 FL=1